MSGSDNEGRGGLVRGGSRRKIPHSTPYIDMYGNYTGNMCSADTVREVLTESGYFDAHDVSLWGEPLLVPFGKDNVDHIFVTVARTGVRLNGIYSFGKIVSGSGRTRKELDQNQ
jgi:hypothetical protein